MHRTLQARAVAVDATDNSARKSNAQSLFEAFGSFTEGLCGLAAFIAAFVKHSCVPTVVASQLAAAGMDGQPGVASFASGDVPALSTDQGRRKAPPVKKQENLAVAVEMTPNRFGQWFADTVAGWCAYCVNQANDGWLCMSGARWQDDVAVRAAAAMLQHFKRRCSAAQDDRDIQVLRPGNCEVPC